MKQFITEILDQAGEEIMKYYGHSDILYTKQGAADIVTNADLASNSIITEAIKRKFPDHGILSEENEGYNTGAEYCWYIDPLDGTRNFATNTPLFGINLALSYRGEVTHGAIYQPLTKELVYAEVGNGAYLNGVKTNCSQKIGWEGTYGIFPVKSNPENVSVMQKIHKISEQTAWMSMVGSSAIAGAWVSTGRRDWYLTPNKNIWDLAANSLIAKESGAIVTNLSGEPYKPGDKGLVIANESVHPELLRFVRESYLV